MAQLAVGGYVIQVYEVSLVGRPTAGGRALEIRSQWHATTDDHEPVLALELSDGLVARYGSDGAPRCGVVMSGKGAPQPAENRGRG